jgi:urease accessory protein
MRSGWRRDSSAYAAALTLGFWLGSPGGASAHPIVEGLPGFPGGLLHPLLVPTHVLTLIAFALVAAQQARRHRSVLTAAFLAASATSIGLISLAFAEDRAGNVLLGCTILASVTVAFGRSLPLLVTLPFFVVAALALMFDSVPASVSIRDTLLALVGTAFSSFVITALLGSLAAMAWRPWQRIAIRISGSWIAAIAALVLALSLR